MTSTTRRGGTGNSRNGRRSKTVLTEAVGPVEIEVPRDRDGTFEPVIVGKRQRRLGDVDTVVLSLYSRGLMRGLTTREISAHYSCAGVSSPDGYRRASALALELASRSPMFAIAEV
jgi:transposase-like protein